MRKPQGHLVLLPLANVDVDKVSAKKRSSKMAAVRSKDTLPEKIVRQSTHRLGYRYRLHCNRLPGNPDLVFPRLRAVIFIHGCFWHQHLQCRRGRLPKSNLDYWRPKLARNVERDITAVSALRSDGWRVMVVWECETKDLKSLKHRLMHFLGPRSATSQNRMDL